MLTPPGVVYLYVYSVDLLPLKVVVNVFVEQLPHTASEGVIGQVQFPVEQAAVKFVTAPE
jgi:hypothetical protein